MSNASRTTPLEFDVEEWLDRFGYEPIEDYAVVGDCHAAALVSRAGSVDWLCLPDFSSPSVFAALLDRRSGGRLVVAPRQGHVAGRRYIGRSAVLETAFDCAGGKLKITDFMPMPADPRKRRLIRLVECVEGCVEIVVLYQPRADYARASGIALQPSPSGWRVPLASGTLDLRADRPLYPNAKGDCAAAIWSLHGGASAAVTLEYSDVQAAPLSLDDIVASKDATRNWWEEWCGRCIYDGDHAEAVMRSCMTLKLLAYAPTGAVTAALTTSLPESLAAARNWDYRFCWLRDTSLLLQSFLHMGFGEESAAFLRWLLQAGRDPRLHPFYDLQGAAVADEIELPHLEGWRGCGPVRVGNSAHGQLQLDIYGELILTAYRFVQGGGKLSAAERQLLASLGDAVCQYWREPDQGIWESRGPARHHTYSKVMCWVALESLLKVDRCLPLGLARESLARERDAIRAAVDAEGYDRALGAYVGWFGGKEPDASLLLMLRYGYLACDDPRAAGTYRHIVDRLGVDGLLYRYPQGTGYDGLPGSENLFVACNFWAVDHLARSGAVDEAMQRFERLLGFANDVGLYAEQFSLADRSARGNFPQAFSHSGLVTAAIAIAQARGGRRGAEIAS